MPLLQREQEEFDKAVTILKTIINAEDLGKAWLCSTQHGEVLRIDNTPENAIPVTIEQIAAFETYTELSNRQTDRTLAIS